VIPRYEQVQVDTGWVKLEAGGKTLLDERVKTDIEEFWDHYQNQTLPKVWQSVMSQVHGELRVVVGATFPLEQAADAHRALEAGQVTGKAVLVMR